MLDFILYLNRLASFEALMLSSIDSIREASTLSLLWLHPSRASPTVVSRASPRWICRDRDFCSAGVTGKSHRITTCSWYRCSWQNSWQYIIATANKNTFWGRDRWYASLQLWSKCGNDKSEIGGWIRRPDKAIDASWVTLGYWLIWRFPARHGGTTSSLDGSWKILAINGWWNHHFSHCDQNQSIGLVVDDPT